MADGAPPVEAVPQFWIGHHENARRTVVGPLLLEQSQDAGVSDLASFAAHAWTNERSLTW